MATRLSFKVIKARGPLCAAGWCHLLGRQQFGIGCWCDGWNVNVNGLELCFLQAVVCVPGLRLLNYLVSLSCSSLNPCFPSMHQPPVTACLPLPVGVWWQLEGHQREAMADGLTLPELLLSTCLDTRSELSIHCVRREGPASQKRQPPLLLGVSLFFLTESQNVQGQTWEAYSCFHHSSLWVNSHSPRAKRNCSKHHLQMQKLVMNQTDSEKLKSRPVGKDAGIISMAGSPNFALGRGLERGGKWPQEG